MSHKIKDAVQPDAWYQALPRPQYKELEQVESADPWFSVYKLETDLYAIYEPKNFQEVISYLMIGSDRALLLDTGMGIGDIKKVVDSLYSGELIVVNTHSHFDHIGGNHQFPLVHILNQESAIGRMKNGLPHEMVEQNIAGDSTVLPYPDGFIPELYHIEPCNFEPIESGHVFDLGDKTLQVIATPGHSPDSIMLFDEKNKRIFTGDTYYPATLYAHLDSPDGLTSVFEIYQATMHEIADRFSSYTVYASHNEPRRPGRVLTEVANAFDDIAAGNVPYDTDEAGRKKYTFDDFCIVTN